MRQQEPAFYHTDGDIYGDLSLVLWTLSTPTKFGAWQFFLIHYKSEDNYFIPVKRRNFINLVDAILGLLQTKYLQ